MKIKKMICKYMSALYIYVQKIQQHNNDNNNTIRCISVY